jgi:formate dehydrogenase major subunit
MAKKDEDLARRSGLSRRDFLKTTAAGAAAAGAVGIDFAIAPMTAAAEEVAATYTTTCPYCSAQCGQKVAVGASGNVLDIYGDMNSPTSRGGLCSKGAGSYQLVNNPRRLGVPEHTAAVDGFDFSGTAWKRIGDQAWTPLALDAAMTEIAAGDGVNHTGLVALRNPVTPGDTAASNAKSVQFFGCSHMNNEPNYLYRKIIANFGTSLTEHQARI